jgi:hypothetical protein
MVRQKNPKQHMSHFESHPTGLWGQKLQFPLGNSIVSKITPPTFPKSKNPPIPQSPFLVHK